MCAMCDTHELYLKSNDDRVHQFQNCRMREWVNEWVSIVTKRMLSRWMTTTLRLAHVCRTVCLNIRIVCRIIFTTDLSVQFWMQILCVPLLRLICLFVWLCVCVSRHVYDNTIEIEKVRKKQFQLITIRNQWLNGKIATKMEMECT